MYGAGAARMEDGKLLQSSNRLKTMLSGEQRWLLNKQKQPEGRWGIHLKQKTRQNVGL